VTEVKIMQKLAELTDRKDTFVRDLEAFVEYQTPNTRRGFDQDGQ
jgi:hypothetical protein